MKDYSQTGEQAVILDAFRRLPGMKDYSQTGEQAVILDVFRRLPGFGFHQPIDSTSGEERIKCQWCDRPRSEWVTPCTAGARFLDLGAYHPTVFSNTRALYELGWAGVMVEAAPVPMRALLAEYGNEPRIDLIQAAVALAPGMVEMHISDDAVSTSNPANYETWAEKGGYIGKLRVPTITLAEIFNYFGGFDFINIDVEGGSADLLLECIKMQVFPRCFCVEFDNRLPEIMTKAGAAGYTAKVCGANVVLWQ